MRIAWTRTTFNPDDTGFDVVADQARRALQAAGHDVVAWTKGVEADFVIAHHEQWWYNSEWREYGPRWAPILLLDHEPISPIILRALDGASALLCPTRRALEVARQEVPDKPALYVPHAFDGRIFHPGPRPQLMPTMNGQEPYNQDAIVIGCVKANSSLRPNFGAVLRAFRYVVDCISARPGDAYLYLHAAPGPRERSEVVGIDLNLAAQRFGLTEYVRFGPFRDSAPGRQARTDGRYRAMLADVYRSFHVNVVPSLGEGFGLTTLEAQSCGVPSLATDWAGGAEMVPPERRIPIAARILNPHMGDQVLVNQDALNDMLLNVIAAKEHRSAAAAAEAWVAPFEESRVAPLWASAAKKLEALL